MAWPDRRILDLFGIELPIVQAPMANFGTPEMAIGAAQAGALGSLACASLNADQIRGAIAVIRKATSRPLNREFLLSHAAARRCGTRSRVARRLAPYYREMDLDPDASVPGAARLPFDDAACALVEELQARSGELSFRPARRSACWRASKRRAPR